MRFFWIAAMSIGSGIAAAEWTVERLPAATQSNGAAVHGGHVYTWGDGLHRDGKKLLGGQFGPGGCLFDGNGDRNIDLILHRLPEEIVWVEGPRFALARRIDTEADFADCLATTVLGRRGVLLTHRGLQVRFYEIPAIPQNEEKWPYREIYSFYTASYQAGLLHRDIDGDGHPDLLCGNYWIQSPAEFALPWRLFAINTYNETPESAHMQLDWRNGSLLASQPALEQGRVSLFTPRRDPKQLWEERPIAAGLLHPRAVAWRNGDLIVSEGTRLWIYSGASRKLLWEGLGVHTLAKTADAVVAIGAGGAVRLKQLP